MQVVVRPAAQADARLTARWLEHVQPGAGTRFLDELESLYLRLEAYPVMYQVFRRDVRRAVLDHFDHAVVYRVKPDSVEIIGVFHCRLSLRHVLKRARAE